VAAESTRPGGRSGGLRADALDLWHVVALGLAFQGLALVVYFNVGVMEVQTGPVVPLVFALVTLAMLPTAVSFAVMNQRRPSAGAGSHWAWEALAPQVGVWLGWMMTTLYLLASILMPFMFGLFSNSLLDAFGVATGFWNAAAGGLFAVAVIAYLTRHDIRLSAGVAALLMLVEVAFVTVLAIFIVVHQGIDGRLSAAPFDPGAW
jgi:amino acid transporter